MSNLSLSGSQPSWEDDNPLNISPQSANVLNSALTVAQSQLQDFFSSPTALERLDRVFEIANQNAAHLLVENGAAGIFDSMPHLQILNDAAMDGAQGAFSKTENTIYLADSLLGGDVRQVEEVLIEEIGHKFDVLLNPGGDTRGDEGELFKNVVLGLPLSDSELLRIQTEDDSSFVVIDNQAVAVEQAYNSTDVTGDGKADAIVSNNEGVYVRRSDGSKFLPNEKWTDIGYWGTKGTWFADATGDGKADAIVSNNEGVYVRRSNGSKFLPNEKWTDIGYWGTQGTWFADVTGDGKADAIVSNNEGVYVRRSDGSKFLPNEKWTDIGYWGTQGTWFADVTGDGKADAIVSNNEGVYVRRSNGSKFLPNEKWTDIGYWGSKGTWFADATGDGKADAIVSNNEGVYVRRSDGSKFLPNEKWTDIGYWGSRVTGFGDATGDGKADAIVSNDDGVYVRRSNGSKFLPNEKWTDIGYWGSKGTWIGDVTLGYYRALSSLSETQWDQQSGDNTQFEQNPYGGGGDQRWKTDDRIEQIYTDLSNEIFGYRVAMTSGYASDQSYYNGVVINGSTGWWHAGLDMGANNGATIKAPLGGTVAWLSGSGDGNIFVGINSDDGRQWVYGHLKSSSGLWKGKRINSGETVGLVGAQNHLHLEVENGLAYGNTNGAMKNQGTLLSATVSPLMAYWKWRNR